MMIQNLLKRYAYAGIVLVAAMCTPALAQFYVVQPQIVAVQPQPVQWRAFWVPTTGLLGRTYWHVQYVAVPVYPQQPPQQPQPQ